MVPTELVWEALRAVYDPEFGLDIVTLGLVYEVEPSAEGKVSVRMTMTTPGCPMRDILVRGVQSALGVLPGVTGVAVEVVWEPTWSPDMIEERGRKLLGT